MSLKIGFVSLGCPKNMLDTEVMLARLAKEGYEITPEQTEADIIVINTCAFIESAKKESIDNILDIAWLKENHKLKGIIVTGCLAQRYRDEVLKEFPEVDAVLGTGSYQSIVKAVEEVAKGNKFIECADENEAQLGGDRIVTTGESYAYLKISEGCNNRCTYCSIPYIRGRYRSRKIDTEYKRKIPFTSDGRYNSGGKRACRYGYPRAYSRRAGYHVIRHRPLRRVQASRAFGAPLKRNEGKMAPYTLLLSR